MGGALLKGIIDAKAANPDDIYVLNRSHESTAKVAQTYGVIAAGGLDEVAECCDTLMLGVKPYQIADTLAELSKLGTSHDATLIISVAAGIPLAAMQAAVDNRARLIRAMPNTPSLIGQGATAYASAEDTTEQDDQTAQTLFSAVGEVFKVEEKHIDAVTGISGSGPAYIYLVIEAMADGGVLAGLPRETALALAAQTVLGAASMVKQTGQHPAQLKDMVTSPGGTTIRGVQNLEDHGVRAAFIDTVMQVRNRAIELGN